MVPKQEMSVTEQTALEQHYSSFRKRHYNETKKKRSTWYRILFPYQADWDVNDNLYARYNSEDVYDRRNGFYSTTTNRFRDHY